MSHDRARRGLRAVCRFLLDGLAAVGSCMGGCPLPGGAVHRYAEDRCAEESHGHAGNGHERERNPARPRRRQAPAPAEEAIPAACLSSRERRLWLDLERRLRG
jgi:hypothetical protein